MSKSLLPPYHNLLYFKKKVPKGILPVTFPIFPDKRKMSETRFYVGPSIQNVMASVLFSDNEATGHITVSNHSHLETVRPTVSWVLNRFYRYRHPIKTLCGALPYYTDDKIRDWEQESICPRPIDLSSCNTITGLCNIISGSLLRYDLRNAESLYNPVPSIFYTTALIGALTKFYEPELIEEHGPCIDNFYAQLESYREGGRTFQNMTLYILIPILQSLIVLLSKDEKELLDLQQTEIQEQIRLHRERHQLRHVSMYLSLFLQTLM